MDDYGLTLSYHAVITRSIQEQLSDYKAHLATFGEDGMMIDDEEEVVRGKIADESDAPWWEAWRKRVRSKALYKIAAPPRFAARSAGRSSRRRRRSALTLLLALLGTSLWRQATSRGTRT